MTALRRTGTRLIFGLIFGYTLLIGTNLFAILRSETRWLSLVLFGVLVAVWLIRRPQNWHATPLDGANAVWLLAFVISLIVNADVWRRSVIGLWFVGLYVLIWYFLNDLIACRRIPRKALADGLLFVGLLQLVFGLFEVWVQIQSTGFHFNALRPGALYGNANALATLLIVLLPIAFSRALSTHRQARFHWSLFTAGLALLLVLTFSRGAWLAAGLATGIQIVLLAYAYRVNPKQRWQRLGPTLQKLLILAAVLLMALIVAAIVFFVGTFSIGGRTTDLRTGIWQPAAELFRESPLVGHGLNSFGRELPRFWSAPPQKVHNHAHNIFLQIGAELGILGLLALAATIVLSVHAMIRRWHESNRAEQVERAGAFAASIAFGLHHLTDMTTMNPAIAVIGVVVLVHALAPDVQRPLPLVSPRIRASLLSALALTLVFSAIWANVQFDRYAVVIAYAIKTDDYRGAATQLEVVASQNPYLVSTYKELGFLYGMAANEGDLEAAQRGIVAFERFVAAEPYIASEWMNLGALYWQVGDHDRALRAMDRAVSLAPQSTALADVRATYQANNARLALPSTASNESLLEADFIYGPSLVQFQFLQPAIPRQFLPQLHYGDS